MQQTSNQSTPLATPLPGRLCNLDRLLEGMRRRGIDGVVLSSTYNVYYLSGFNPIAHKADEPRPYAVVFSVHEPQHPVLIVADYYLGHFLQQPTWVEDVRPFRAVMLPLDLEPTAADIERFIPQAGANTPWIESARGHYATDLVDACRGALRDVGLSTGRVAFDDARLGQRLAAESIETTDAYDVLMYARSVKTSQELTLLREATSINQAAIEKTTKAWERGMSWRELNHAYHAAAIELGGFVHDPGAMVLAHPRGADPAVTLQTGLEDFEVEAGMHVMFDCHGTRNLYCWDGGKTWVVGGEPEGEAKLYARATAEAMRVIEDAMRPGVRISALQSTGREVYRRHGVPSPESALIFFHGVGLSHMDLEQTLADGSPNTNWTLENGMVVASHLLYPGDERRRMWLEDIALITPDGAKPLFNWDFDPIIGA